MSLRILLLVVALCLPAAPASGLARGAVATGTVYLEVDGQNGRGKGEPGVAGVLVSNGETLVRTDAEGHYALPLHAGQAVFVVKPAGHVFPSGSNGMPRYWRHYQPLPGPRLKQGGLATTPRSTRGWDFALLPEPVPAATEGFEMLVFTDTQVKNPAQVGYYLRDIIDPIRGRHAARLGTTLGDLVDDELSLYPQLDAATARLGVPWFHVPGNHDLDFDAAGDAEALSTWRNRYGPDTYAVEEGAASFVFLDDVVYLPGRSPAYVGGLREEQFVFLEHYLATVAKDRLLVLGIHIPLFDAEPGRETFRHADRDRLFALLQPFPHVLVLSGHSHAQRHVWHDAGDGWHGASPLHEYNVGAACGAYWSGVKDASGIPDATMSDGTPNGYATLRVMPRGDYALAWHPARDPGDSKIGLHAPAVLRQGAYPAWGVYANVYMGDDSTRVEYRVDDGDWKPMHQLVQPDPGLLVENVRDDLATELRGYDRSPEASASPHLWRGALPTGLALGEHVVEVRAFDRWRGEQHASTRYRLATVAP